MSCSCDLYERFSGLYARTIYNDKKKSILFPLSICCNYDNYRDDLVRYKDGLITHFTLWETKSFQTECFTQNMEQVCMICPLHHPFFPFLIADKLNLPFNEYSHCIHHAWYHKETGDLKLLWNNEETYTSQRDKLRFGMRKAWRMFIKNPGANVTYYYYNHFEEDIVTDDENEDDMYNT